MDAAAGGRPRLIFSREDYQRRREREPWLLCDFLDFFDFLLCDFLDFELLVL
jgi:hypothetical protein